MKHKSVPMYLLQTSDSAVTSDDLVADVYVYLLEKSGVYDAEKSALLDWAFYKARRYLQSYFRQLTNRRQLRRTRIDKPARKGIVRYGQTFSNAPNQHHYGDLDEDSELCVAPTNHDDNTAYRLLGRQVDTRPSEEWLIDLRDAVDSLDKPLREVIELVIKGLPVDQIAWQLNISSSAVNARKTKGLDCLRSVLHI